MGRYQEILSLVTANTVSDQPEEVSYCEHFLMLMIDLEALLPTR